MRKKSKVKSLLFLLRDFTILGIFFYGCLCLAAKFFNLSSFEKVGAEVVKFFAHQ